MNSITDLELQGPTPAGVLSSTLINNNLLPPSSPVQPRRDSILKHQGSVKTDKRVSIKQTPTKLPATGTSNIEYVSEKFNESTNSVGSIKKRQGKPPSGKCESKFFCNFKKQI